jgi:hypothetical protein
MVMMPILRTILLVAAVMFGVLCVGMAIFLLVVLQHSGIDVKVIVLCLALGSASAISFGVWLFLRAK